MKQLKESVIIFLKQKNQKNFEQCRRLSEECGEEVLLQIMRKNLLQSMTIIYAVVW